MDKLVEECNENIVEIIVLGVIVLTICIEIGAYYAYKYMNRNKEDISTYDYVYHAKNY